MKLFSSPLLLLSLLFCLTFFIQTNTVKAQDTLLSEGFDDFAIMPPVGWTNIKVAGTGLPGLFTRVTTGGGPIQEPHTDPAEVKFNSFYFAAGTACDLSTSVLNFTVTGSYTVSFWMYRDPGFGSDKLEVYVNTTNASAGGTLLGTINRKMTATPSETSEGWYNYTFTIPSTYNTASNYIIFKAISGFGFIIYMDDISVQRNVVTSPGCLTSFSPPEAATGICRNMEITWDIVPYATGYKITMGSNAPNYNNIASNVDLGTALSYAALLSPNTLYKWKVRPYNATGITSCILNSFTTGANVCYAEALYIESSCLTFDFIDDFSTSGAVSNISNLNTSCSANPGNYTYFSGLTAVANLSSTFNISLQSGVDYEQGYGIWVDWNIDGDFNDAGEFAFQSTTPTTAIVNGTITVPGTATIGVTRMRVRSLYNALPLAGESTALYNEGEAEDYNLSVTNCTPVTYYQDADGDGYGNIAITTTSCLGVPPGYSANSTDCNDLLASINPGATELCNGIDENCNVTIDEGAATATITPAGATTVCKGTNLILNANTGAGYTYQWKRNGATLAGGTGATYNVTKSGNYTVTVTVPGGCNATSAITSCTVNSNPNATISTPDGTDLCGLPNVDLVANAGAGFTYLWIKDGATIPGETNQTLVVTVPGAYRVKVFNAAGCSKTSAIKTINKSCKEGDLNFDAQLEVYPNPAKDQFNIVFTSENIGQNTAQLTITDLLGNIIITKNVALANNNYSDVISTVNFASGVYMIKIATGEIQMVKQLVINK